MWERTPLGVGSSKQLLNKFLMHAAALWETLTLCKKKNYETYNLITRQIYCMTNYKANIKSARKQYLASKPSTIVFYYLSVFTCIVFLQYLSMLVRATMHDNNLHTIFFNTVIQFFLVSPRPFQIFSKVLHGCICIMDVFEDIDPILVRLLCKKSAFMSN